MAEQFLNLVIFKKTLPSLAAFWPFLLVPGLVGG